MKHCPIGAASQAFAGSIHPQGWVPIETPPDSRSSDAVNEPVAFTPKGGCPLKLGGNHIDASVAQVAFTPKGGCPLKPSGTIRIRRSAVR